MPLEYILPQRLLNAAPSAVEPRYPRPGAPYHKPNGGTRSGAAAAKRRARTRRNVRKNPRGSR